MLTSGFSKLLMPTSIAYTPKVQLLPCWCITSLTCLPASPSMPWLSNESSKHCGIQKPVIPKGQWRLQLWWSLRIKISSFSASSTPLGLTLSFSHFSSFSLSPHGLCFLLLCLKCHQESLSVLYLFSWFLEHSPHSYPAYIHGPQIKTFLSITPLTNSNFNAQYFYVILVNGVCKLLLHVLRLRHCYTL